MFGELISAGLDFISDSKDRKATEKANEQNAALQREFAQNSIQWKVQDAEKAGIHKMYALGAQGTPGMASYMPATSSGLSNAGQALARAANSGKTTMDRLNERLLETQIEGQEIDNMKKRSDMALKGAAASSPPFPSIGFDGNITPAQTTMAGHGYTRPMIHPDLSQSREEMPSEWARQLLEDAIINPYNYTKQFIRQERDAWRDRRRSFGWR